MNIAILTPPGKFPTLNHDPGGVYSTAALFHEKNLQLLSINYYWWYEILTGLIEKHILAPYNFSQRLRKRVEWRAEGLDLKRGYKRAREALNSFKRRDTFTCLETYQHNVHHLLNGIKSNNKIQNEFHISLFSGAIVRGLNYASSEDLCAYAKKDSLLYKTIFETIANINISADIILFKITSAEDFLMAMMASRCLRELNNNDIYICLAEHGYENFSLHIHIEELKKNKQIHDYFDSVIVTKDTKTDILKSLLTELEKGHRPKGFLDDLPVENRSLDKELAKNISIPVLPAYSPVPILWTRLSEKKCYWSKCTFCVQNAKHTNPKPTAPYEINEMIVRLKNLVNVGYEHFIFSDEALSPAFLKYFSMQLIESGLSIHWSCRCRLESTFNKDILQLMKKSGCYEILFGLESSSSRILSLMKKHLNGLDLNMVKNLLHMCTEAGIATHLTMIVGFPGETFSEAEQTICFAIDALKNSINATYKVNLFALFPDTPIAESPVEFGINLPKFTGDIPVSMKYTLSGNDEVERKEIIEKYGALKTELDEGLGWSRYKLGNEESITEDNGALHMYFHTGHGTFFKLLETNPFATGV